MAQLVSIVGWLWMILFFQVKMLSPLVVKDVNGEGFGMAFMKCRMMNAKLCKSWELQVSSL